MSKLVTAPPKTMQVAEILREEIRTQQLRPGDRLQTARALAERFAVSKQVVQRSFAMLEREGLLETHVGRGTFVATPAKSIASRTIVMMLNGTTDKHRRLPLTLTATIQQRGFMPYLFETEQSHDAATLANVRALLAERPRAFVAATYCRFNFDILDWVDPATQLVCVSHFEGERDYAASYILEDFVAAGRQAGEYLLARGRRRIAAVSYERQPGWTSDHLLRGLELALADAGLKVSHYVDEHDPASVVDACFDGDQRPDGIFCVADFQYRRIADSIARRGLVVGRDFDAIGIGNTPWAELYGIATMDYREDELAAEVAATIERGKPRRMCLVPTLVLPQKQQ